MEIRGKICGSVRGMFLVVEMMIIKRFVGMQNGRGDNGILRGYI